MDPYKFIQEIKARELIWNPRGISQEDRELKRQAWREVAAKMYPEFYSCSKVEKSEKVLELQRKWKSLKDYYNRRDPKKDLDEKTHRKKPIIDLLQFLDKVYVLDHCNQAEKRLTTDSKKIKRNNFFIQFPQYKIRFRKFIDNQPTKPWNTNTKTFRCPKHNLEYEFQQNDAMKFLRDLLPAMQTLSDRQRLEFKLEVMMLIKKIKYDEVDNSLFYDTPAVIELLPGSKPSDN